MFKVRDKNYENYVYTVYKVNKKGDMFLIYDGTWQWVWSNDYIPIED